ncbi:aldehyde dehydrogenase family protein [bacterium]|nr:aldehyde dehydrogenase family protein [bacterium]
MTEYKFYLNGKMCSSKLKYKLFAPYKGKSIGNVYRPEKKHVEKAIDGACKAFEITRKYPVFKRVEILESIIQGIKKRKSELEKTIVLEAGKCLKHARGEVKRAICTFTIAKEECSRIEGGIIPLDILSANVNRTGIIKRFPIGPVLGITPFNFPLNLVAHKVAPAIASGNPIIIKPASQTPLSSLILAEIIQESGIESGAFSVLTVPGKDAEKMVQDSRIKKISFTGSADVGWKLKSICGKKRITLELGGNCAAIIHTDANLDYAIERSLMGAFAYQGQVCIHLQRLFIHKKIYKKFKKKFLDKVRNLKLGNPSYLKTDIGPMINIKEAKRVELWIREAEKDGAKVLMGGKREDNFVTPTVVENCPVESLLNRCEVFGPVLLLQEYDDFSDAVACVNNSEYGLQAGVFTNDIKRIWYSFDEIQTGGIVINDVPTFRVDSQPYGGLKSSGIGREGIKYAIEEMTEIKTLLLNLNN